MQVHVLDHSVDGQWLLVISGTMQAKVFDRDGDEEKAWVYSPWWRDAECRKEFVRGDVYLRDMKNTKCVFLPQFSHLLLLIQQLTGVDDRGHTAEINCG